MRIMPNTFAVFWARKGWKQSFHADVPATTPQQAARMFKMLWPQDIIRSVRGPNGRFVRFH